LRRPLFQLDNSENPNFLIAPAILRESFIYQMRSFLEGNFPRRHLKSDPMKAWKSKIDGDVGNTFELEIVQAIKKLNWSVRHSVNITEIFGKKLDRNYGEVDVLAWHHPTGKIFLIECKDVQYKKTPGEVAEQLSDFLGKEDKKGKADLLLKHIRRVDLLRENQEVLKSFCTIGKDIKIEALMLFRHPVPMLHAWKNNSQKTRIGIKSELPDILKS